MQVLTDLREALDEANSGQNSITLPPNLTNMQRKFVHELSKQLGLKSKSHSKGKDTKVVVRKVLGGGGAGIGTGLFDGGGGNDRERNGSSLPTEAEYGQVLLIDMGMRGKEALRWHVSKFLASTREETESREAGGYAGRRSSR